MKRSESFNHFASDLKKSTIENKDDTKSVEERFNELEVRIKSLETRLDKSDKLRVENGVFDARITTYSVNY